MSMENVKHAVTVSVGVAASANCKWSDKYWNPKVFAESH